MSQGKWKKHALQRNVILVLCLIVFLSYFFHQKEYANKSVASQIQAENLQAFTLAQETISDEQEFFGSLQAKRESDLSAKVAGRISTIKVEEGDYVKSGQLLAFLFADQNWIDLKNKENDFNNFEDFREDQAKYWDRQVSIAKRNLEIKEEERDYTELHDPGRVSIVNDEVDKAEAELRSVKKQRDAQKESLNEQSVNLGGSTSLAAQNVSDTRIRSPFNGVVVKKYLEVGEVVGAGQPVISIADVSSFKVVIEVPDTLADRLLVGLKGRVTLDGLPGEYMGTVTMVNPQVDSVAKKIKVEVTLNTAPVGAKVDMFARVLLEFPARNAFFVPNNFIFSGYEGPYVILLDGTQQLVQKNSEKEGETEIFFEGIADGVILKRS